MPTSSNDPTARLATLLEFLRKDPSNASLLTEATEAALAADQVEVADRLVRQFPNYPDLPAPLANLAGLTALRTANYADAVTFFEQALDTAPADAGLRFNLAWSEAMLKDFEAALALLDDATTDKLPQAATLKVQILHELARFEEATEHAKRLLQRHPEHEGLNAAASVLAVDIGDLELARACASRAHAHPDAMTTLGTLALSQGDDRAALAQFEAALSCSPRAPRAWIGKGLAELASGRHDDAATALQHGAELFGDHLGSWLAAGWAHVVRRDFATARQCFEHALALDDTFAESHGSLAALAVIENRPDEAHKRLQLAQRLDRECFSAALAQAMQLASNGDAQRAQAILERAFNTPIGEQKETISRYLAKRALGA